MHRDTKDKHNPEGHDMKGIHKDTKTFLIKKNVSEKTCLMILIG